LKVFLNRCGNTICSLRETVFPVGRVQAPSAQFSLASPAFALVFGCISN
jgi:hypothetical protein